MSGGGPGGWSPGRPNPPGPLPKGACAGGPSAMPGLMGTVGGIMPATGGWPCRGGCIIGPPPPPLPNGGGPPGGIGGGAPGGGPWGAMPKLGGFGGALCSMLTANSGSIILTDMQHVISALSKMMSSWKIMEEHFKFEVTDTLGHFSKRKQVTK